MANRSKALVAAHVTRRRQRWEVEFARFFAMPQRGPSSPPPPGLRHLPPGKLRCPGTWLPATAPASLTFSRPHPAASPVLSVFIGDALFEEHFVSILNFSWPQVTCVTQRPIRGSRLVFMSFCDKSRQIQKFALQQCSGDTVDSISSGSDYVCKDSSASEYIASNGLPHRPDKGSSFVEPASYYRIAVPPLGHNEEADQRALEPLHANNIENIFSSFPTRFTEMLTNFSNESERCRGTLYWNRQFSSSGANNGFFS